MVKDPIENAIIITPEIKYVIVEGLYLFDTQLGMN
jgi:pantothenate kinase